MLGARFGTAPNLVRLIQKIGHEARLIYTARELNDVSALVLPGVGSFDAGANQLQSAGLFESVRKFVESGKPTLGICLGMQLLCESSEEGSAEGLGVLPLRVESLYKPGEPATPHIGWNQVTGVGHGKRFLGDSDGQYFYFSHSYGVPFDASFALSVTFHNSQFSSIVARDNVIGMQFHAEKSHRNGMQIMSQTISHLEPYFA